MRAKYLQISGISGIVLTLFGVIAYSFTRNPADPYVLIHLALGVLSLLAYAVTQGGTLIGSFRRRSARYGFHSLLYSLLFLGILLMLNILSNRYHKRWDLTEAQVFSLSSQTANVLGQLRQDLEMYAFLDRGENPAAMDLLKTYAGHSPKVKLQAVDPDRHPEMTRRFKIQQTNTVHIRYGKEFTNITDLSEEAVTNAVIKLTKAGKKNVYFLTGHGEPRIDDRENVQGFAAAKDALENENYQVKNLLLSTQESVPKEASLLIIAAPQKPVLDPEVKAIEKYMQNGGRLLILLPSTGTNGLGNLLQEWGVAIGDDIVVDQVIRLFAGPSLGVEPIADTYNDVHPITREFKERTIFPLVRSVESVKAAREGIDASSLVRTSPTSWAEKDLDGVFKQGNASFGPQDTKGPVSIAVAATGKAKTADSEKDGETKIVVVGTAGFANNRFINIYFNRDFFINITNWLVGQEELISIRPRTIRSSQIHLTENEGTAVFYLSFLIMPELLLIIGLAVWWRRR